MPLLFSRNLIPISSNQHMFVMGRDPFQDIVHVMNFLPTRNIQRYKPEKAGIHDNSVFCNESYACCEESQIFLKYTAAPPRPRQSEQKVCQLLSRRKGRLISVRIANEKPCRILVSSFWRIGLTNPLTFKARPLVIFKAMRETKIFWKSSFLFDLV